MPLPTTFYNRLSPLVARELLGCILVSRREEGGCAYVYFTYDMHWMLNVSSEANGQPAAILLRAVEPLDGWMVHTKRPCIIVQSFWHI